MLFGHGMFGGMGGFASILGLLLQIGLVVIVARLLFSWWQRRSSPQAAYAAADAPAHPATGQSFSGLGGMFGGGGGNAAPAGQPLTVVKEDYDAFERLLEDVQAAYSAEDLNALRREVTPEMLSYFSEELADHASRGVINRVTDVKLLQGDLSEAWSEGNAEYATVAMHFGLIDTLVDRASGQMKQEIDDARLLLAAEQPTVELLEPRTDAGERRNQGKKRIEQARPHEHPDFRRQCSRGRAG